VILLIGLAVGVDYSLFYLKREREERAAGKSSRAAIEAAAATSGRSVLISGFTVMIAMAGMLFAGDKSYLGFGIATMMVVGIAMLGSLTVLPALLSKLGDRVEKGKIPFLHRLRRDSGENRMWTKILAPAMRRPGIAAAVAGGALVLMALPVFHLHTAQSGMNALPNNAPTVGTIKKVSAAFSDGEVNQSQVAIKADMDSSATQQALASLKTKVEAEHLNAGSIDVEVNPSHTVARKDTYVEQCGLAVVFRPRDHTETTPGRHSPEFRRGSAGLERPLLGEERRPWWDSSRSILSLATRHSKCSPELAKQASSASNSALRPVG
jgi:RND superfamily putative drug exporter